mgnify:CR=1 FL=1
MFLLCSRGFLLFVPLGFALLWLRVRVLVCPSLAAAARMCPHSRQRSPRHIVSAVTMKATLLTLALAVAGTAALPECSCANGFTCASYETLSVDGKKCATSNKVLSLTAGSNSLNDCAAAVDADGECSSVFAYSPDTSTASATCECHVSASPDSTCTVVSAAPLNRMQLYEVGTSSVCECSEVDGTVYTGSDCSVETTDANRLDFYRELNALNVYLSTGEVLVDARVRAAGDARIAGIFSDISVVQPATILNRGTDASFTLLVSATSRSVSPSLWLDAVSDSAVAELQELTFSVTDANFQVESSSNPTEVPCVCPPVSVSTTPCDSNSTCYAYTVEFTFLEAPKLAEWELALIILAFVLFFCVLAVGLSSYHPPAPEPADPKKNAVREFAVTVLSNLLNRYLPACATCGVVRWFLCRPPAARRPPHFVGARALSDGVSVVSLLLGCSCRPKETTRRRVSN